ncbi:hypothetical protein SAY86_002134 [Trapa natans]|uniref:LOB domain-containing protein n=1 Tax=Trapa natans TaxID=22666 RepID=A0AAN7LHB3_TRANT|nr:hypothetical protein SAY86_002134 [Trapa natans]
MSCNGCRALRKGCSEDCVIRPCLQWISSPESQANATIFLTKFYGRAGLNNLITAGPVHLRPAIFRSLLYEACGRVINPVYGAVGLLWSGNWSQCQDAVDSILKGSSHIMRHPTLSTSSNQTLPEMRPWDIRHVPKIAAAPSATSINDLYKVRSEPRFKLSFPRPDETKPETRWLYEMARCESTWKSEPVHKRDSPEGEVTDSGFSVETIETSAATGSASNQILRFSSPKNTQIDQSVKLELSLGTGPRATCHGTRG